MAQTYDNCCEECGQDRDAERRLRALWTAYRQQGENYVEAITLADRAEWALKLERSESGNTRQQALAVANLKDEYKTLHRMVLTLREAAPNTQHAHDLWEEIDHFLDDNPPK